MKQIAAVLLASAALGFGDNVVEGNPKSPVRVIAYESLQCTDCAVYRRMLDEQLLSKYGDRVAFEHRDFPLPRHKWSRPAAMAARHFDRINGALGIEFRRWAVNNIANLTPENFSDKLREWAQAHGVDGAKAVAALNEPALAKLVEEDYQDGIARGVARTPTVFVNGEPFIEPSTPDEIAKAIDAALAATQKK
jgi:protein-disulfide isomerase